MSLQKEIENLTPTQIAKMIIGSIVFNYELPGKDNIFNRKIEKALNKISDRFLNGNLPINDVEEFLREYNNKKQKVHKSHNG